MSIRRVVICLSMVFLVVVSIGIPFRSQLASAGTTQTPTIIAGRNVNMVSGTRLPFGDPWLQRQNEPSIAASTRNPMHLLGGGNDYRTIDFPEGLKLPGIERAASANPDAWLGVYESFDDGESWVTMLLPGFPQDESSQGKASPIYGYDTACDPILRAGANGLFYYCGIAFNRPTGTSPTPTSSAIFVARYVDDNNLEKVELTNVDGTPHYSGPIQYIDTHLVATGSSDSSFIDMPNMAVDIPRGSARYGTIYVAYTVFSSTPPSNTADKIFLQRSTDGGVTWSTTPPVQVSTNGDIVQRPIIAVDPTDLRGNTIYVAFRRFAKGNVPDGIAVVRSTDGGKTFSKLPDPAPSFYPFDQGTSSSPESFRTNSYPTIAVGDLGTVYVAWSQRQGGLTGQARIMISALRKGSLTWTPAQVVDGSYAGIGHQFMPSLAFAAWKLMLAWYDQRNDVALDSSQFIGDRQGITRHTIDVRAAEGTPGLPPKFSPSVQLSRYLYVLALDTKGNPIPDGSYYQVLQAEYNHINYPLFQQGTVPFHGDYLDVTPSVKILPPAIAFGSWIYNINPLEPTSFHAAWTDNRDVRPPNEDNPSEWSNYSAPTSTQEYWQHRVTPGCADGSKTGMRNQNIYTAHIDKGLVMGSPGNTKQLDLSMAGEGGRTFVVFVKDTTGTARTLNLILLQIGGVNASFDQFQDINRLKVSLQPFSSASCTVYVDRSTRPLAPVAVDAFEGLKLVGYVVLNPDPTNLPLNDPNNPFQDLGKETHNPDVSDPFVWDYDLGTTVDPSASALLNPRVQNPRVQNDSIVNPRVQNEGVLNPRVQNQSIVNNDVPNPRVQNTAAPNAALTDVTWTVTNEGNTTSVFTTNIRSQHPEYFTGDKPPLIAQVLVYKVHRVPVDKDCQLYETHQDELIANISNPRVQNPRVQNNPITNSAVNALAATQAADLGAQDITFYLAPGEQAGVTLRVWDQNTTDGSPTFSPDLVVAEAVAGAVNSVDVEEGGTTPPSAVPPNSQPWTTSLPTIAVVPSSVSFTATVGINPADRVISLQNSGSGTLNYTLSADAAWLSVAPASGQAPQNLTLHVDVTGLGPGVYTATITISGPNAVNNPVRIPVYLTIGSEVPSPAMTVWANGITGTSIYPGTAYDFGPVGDGTTRDITFTITNYNELSANLILGGNPIITITGVNADQFSVQQQPTSPVPAGGETTFVIRFQPTSPGLKTATISIANNTVDENPYGFTLQGNGTAPIGGLIAYYPFNGNANDESGNGHNGTIHGTPIYSNDRNGNPSGALNFDGASNYVELPGESSFDLPQITIVAIAKVPSYAKRNPIISKGREFGSFTVHVTSPDGLPYYTYQDATGNETEPIANEPVGQNQFFHLVSTYDSSSRQLRGYLNGVLKQSLTCQTSPLMNGENVTIGLSSFQSAPPEFFNGVIDEIRIYNRILSASEVQALYATDTGQVAYYPFNGNANDESGHGFNGTVNGATLVADRFGNQNRAYSFNGSTTPLIDVGNIESFNFGTGDFTLETWIQMDPDSLGPRHILGKRRTDDYGPPYTYDWTRLYSLDGSIRFEFSNGPVLYTPTAYNDGLWHHIVATRSNGAVSLYIDGQLVLSDTNTAGVSNTASFTIGKWSFENSFHGKIDDIRIYNRALSGAEVAAHFLLWSNGAGY